MKKILIFALLLAMVAAALLAEGCGKDETGTDGNTTKTENGDTSDMEEAELPDKAGAYVPTEEDLMAPIYPGAEFLPMSGGTGEGEVEGEYRFQSTGMFETFDEYDKVVNWYIDKVGEPVWYYPESANWELSPEKNTAIGISVSNRGDRVHITINRLTVIE